MEALKYITEGFAQTWALDVIAGLLFPAFIYGCLWSVGKEDVVISSKRRRWFILPAFMIAFLATHLMAVAYKQLREINRGVATATAGSGHVKASIVRVSILPSPTDGKAIIYTYLRGVNNGPSTSLINWRLMVILPSNQSFTFGELPPQIIPPFSPSAPVHLRTFFSDKQKHLPSSTMERPIPHRGGFEGWVAFGTLDSSGLKHSSILDGSKFRLHCEEADGHPIEVDYSFSGVDVIEAKSEK